MMKLEISGLSFSYGERQVLEDISFGVAEGELSLIHISEPTRH